jgi:aryl-alcohol dehydrogenase-like predicted oxidoreductase
MEALNSLIKDGKVRALGASAMYGYQFFNMQLAAERNGWAPFVSMQNHYNLLYREDERELIPVCNQQNVSRTPYSPLAAGRLSRLEWKTDTKRSQMDKIAISKYDGTQEADYKIALRVNELARKYDATMTQISLVWQFAKEVTSPIIGATKPEYFDDAVGVFKVKLTEDDIVYLEELYAPHKIVGAI